HLHLLRLQPQRPHIVRQQIPILVIPRIHHHQSVPRLHHIRTNRQRPNVRHRPVNPLRRRIGLLFPLLIHIRPKPKRRPKRHHKLPNKSPPTINRGSSNTTSAGPS